MLIFHPSMVYFPIVILNQPCNSLPSIHILKNTTFQGVGGTVKGQLISATNLVNWNWVWANFQICVETLWPRII